MRQAFAYHRRIRAEKEDLPSVKVEVVESRANPPSPGSIGPSYGTRRLERTQPVNPASLSYLLESQQLLDMSLTNPLMGLEQTVGPELLKEFQLSKLLVVGSGGIGCELLKNLALSGFRHVEVVDLDTIDVSNLNRQLLFRSQHVGMAKCTVACEVAAAMVPPTQDSSLPPVHYQAHHGNVCDNTKFNVPFVKQFDLVLNALDNVEARRRVNRLCLAADTPLVEATSHFKSSGSKSRSFTSPVAWLATNAKPKKPKRFIQFALFGPPRVCLFIP